MKHLLNRTQARRLIHSTLREFGCRRPRVPDSFLLGVETVFAERLRSFALAELGPGKPPLAPNCIRHSSFQ